MPFDHLTIERTGALAVITIQRQDKLNALNAHLLAELDRAFASLAEATGDDAVRAAVLTGAGKAFVAGADIAEMANLRPTQAKSFAEAGHRLAARIETSPF